MAVDMFMKIDKIKGESKDKTHKESIEILAWSWGMSQSGTMHSGSGGGAGKVNVQDFSFTKYIDRSTTNLVDYCCRGKHFEEAKLTVRRAGGSQVTYLTLTMKDVLVSSVQSGGSGGEDRITENVTLNFREFTLEYTPQKPDGTGDTAIPVSWDIAANAEKA